MIELLLRNYVTSRILADNKKLRMLTIAIEHWCAKNGYTTEDFMNDDNLARQCVADLYEVVSRIADE